MFHSGDANTFVYKQVLNYYKEDLSSFQPKFFQQDGARAHSSKGSQQEIIGLFNSNFIPTWVDGPDINGQKNPKMASKFTRSFRYRINIGNNQRNAKYVCA